MGAPPFAGEAIGNYYLVNGSEQGGAWYAGPVSGIVNQLVLSAGAALNVTAQIPNVFIHGGSGDDALDMSGVNGNNILDGSTGSNFLVGGTGDDTFYIDDRAPLANIWSTVVGFRSGDVIDVWGITAADRMNVVPFAGANNYGGVTLSFSGSAHDVNLTVAGHVGADLAFSYGRTPDLPNLPGSDYLQIREA